MSGGLTQAAVDRLGLQVGELIAEHAGPEIQDLQQWADDPIGFAENIGRDPVDYQRRIMESVVASKYTVVRGCHGSGKEWVAGQVAIWAAYCRRILVLTVSATELQVVGQTMKEVRAAWRAAGAVGQLFTRSVRIGGEDRIIALTGGSSIDSLTGWHDPKGVFVIISEAQGERLEDSAYDAALAVATDDMSRVLVMGNPVRPTGRFYEICQKDHWAKHHVSAFDTPNLKAGKMVRAGFPSPDWPSEIQREYGATSPYYVGRVLGEFPSQGEESLFDRNWLNAAADRWDLGFLQAQANGLAPILSVDPARYGPDSTVCAVRRGMAIERLIEWHGKSTMETVQRVAAEAAKAGVYPWRTDYQCEAYGQIVVDVVGLGAGIVDRLRELGYSVRGFNGGSFTTQQHKFLNLRASSYWNLRTLLEEGRIALPRDPGLFEELLAIRWFPTSEGKVQLERKVDMKRRLGKSPDRADAVSMAFGARGASMVVGEIIYAG